MSGSWQIPPNYQRNSTLWLYNLPPLPFHEVPCPILTTIKDCLNEKGNDFPRIFFSNMFIPLRTFPPPPPRRTTFPNFLMIRPSQVCGWFIFGAAHLITIILNHNCWILPQEMFVACDSSTFLGSQICYSPPFEGTFVLWTPLRIVWFPHRVKENNKTGLRHF